MSTNYLVLARKWRPQQFSDVVGQDTIIQTLSKALLTHRVAHAFLLTGSRGVGKTTIARLLAKALSCEKGISPNPCGVCSHCLEITSGTSMDIVEIDGASNTGVDDVRELRDNLRYQPASARFKIFIIDEVHMLSSSAFNALLKTLEEPPPHVKFIFATTEAHKIPVTILSRCQRYDFKRISVSVIVEKLKLILSQENMKVDPEGLLLIAQSAEGGMRDALSLLDQVISFSGDEASLEDVTQILGLVDQRSIQMVTDALINQDAKKALEVLQTASDLGWDLKQLSDHIAMELRNLCIASCAGSIVGLADLTPDRAKRIDERALKIDLLDLQRLLNTLLQAMDQMTYSQQPKLVLELAFMKMAGRPMLAQMTEVKAAIERLESICKMPVQQTEFVTDKQTSWELFVNQAKEYFPLQAIHLEYARLLEDKTMEFDERLHLVRSEDLAQNPKFQDIFRDSFGCLPKLSLSQTLREKSELKAKLEQEQIEEKARSNPSIQKALSIFGGEIKMVKKT